MQVERGGRLDNLHAAPPLARWGGLTCLQRFAPVNRKYAMALVLLSCCNWKIGTLQSRYRLALKHSPPRASVLVSCSAALARVQIQAAAAT